jgi:uncharacterized protein with NRDE domain
MCSIILRIGEEGVLIGANRDEMLAREWDPPGRYWPQIPEVIAGRDRAAGGTWLGLNRRGMIAAVLNRHGTLGPAAGKRSRGELPLLALAEPSLAAARDKILELDTGDYRSFNLVLADAEAGMFFRGVEAGPPALQMLGPGTWMITSGDANDLSMPRIARYLPKFATAPAQAWTALLSDRSPPVESVLNIPPRDGFGTVSSAFITLGRDRPPRFLFAPAPPQLDEFRAVSLG